MEIIKAGTKIVFKAHAGQCGTDACEFYVLTDDITENHLNDLAYSFGVEHAESYGIYPEDEASEEDIEESPDDYSSNIEGWYEIYDPKEHDGLRVGDGNEFTEL